MSPLEAAQALARHDDEPTYYEDNPGERSTYVFCGGSFGGGHAPGCPWLALPEVVAALEAAALVAYQDGLKSDSYLGPVARLRETLEA